LFILSFIVRHRLKQFEVVDVLDLNGLVFPAASEAVPDMNVDAVPRLNSTCPVQEVIAPDVDSPTRLERTQLRIRGHAVPIDPGNQDFFILGARAFIGALKGSDDADHRRHGDVVVRWNGDVLAKFVVPVVGDPRLEAGLHHVDRFDLLQVHFPA